MSEHHVIRYSFDPRAGYVTATTSPAETQKIIEHHTLVPVEVKHEAVQRYPYNVVEVPADFTNSTQQTIKVVQQQEVIQAVKHEPVRIPYISPEYITQEESANQVVAKKVKAERTRFPCDQCEYAATTASYLNKHKKVKHEGVRFPYIQSDYNIVTQTILKQNGKVKQCDQCDYVTAKTSSLKHHRRSKHEGIVFPCDQCEYTATTSSNLTKHKMSKHEGVRFACDKCEYAATLPSDLTKHIRNKHEGIKYPCDHCDFASTTTSSLRQHVRYKHEGVRFHCDQCDYAATTSSNLTKHKLSTNCVLRNKTYKNMTPLPAPILTNVSSDQQQQQQQPSNPVMTITVRDDEKNPQQATLHLPANLSINIPNSVGGSSTLAIPTSSISTILPASTMSTMLPTIPIPASSIAAILPHSSSTISTISIPNSINLTQAGNITMNVPNNLSMNGPHKFTIQHGQVQ